MILPSAAGFGWVAGKSILALLVTNFPSPQSSTGLYRSENKSSAEWKRLSNPLFPFLTLNSLKAPAIAPPAAPPSAVPAASRRQRGRARRRSPRLGPLRSPPAPPFIAGLLQPNTVSSQPTVLQ